MVAINVSTELYERISNLAAKAEQSRERVVREALLSYVEDMEDAFLAIERLKSNELPIPLEEVMRKYGTERVD